MVAESDEIVEATLHYKPDNTVVATIDKPLLGTLRTGQETPSLKLLERHSPYSDSAETDFCCYNPMDDGQKVFLFLTYPRDGVDTNPGKSSDGRRFPAVRGMMLINDAGRVQEYYSQCVTENPYPACTEGYGFRDASAAEGRKQKPEPSNYDQSKFPTVEQTDSRISHLVLIKHLRMVFGGD